MKRKIPLLLGVFVLLSCTEIRYHDNNADYIVNAIEMDWSDDNEDIRFRFNVIDKKADDKVVWKEMTKEHIDVVSDGEFMTVKDLSKLPNQAGYIPDNIIVSLLVDKSIQAGDMDQVRKAVIKFVEELPENSVYISFFDEELRNTKKITLENFTEFSSEFTISTNYKLLFDAALKKFKELCGERTGVMDPQLTARIDNDDIQHYLVLLTDGRVDENNLRTADDIQKFSEYVQRLDANVNNKRRVEIHAIRFGALEEDVDQTLSYLCVDLRNPNVRGGLYISDPDAFIERLKVSDKNYPDWELTAQYPNKKFHYGEAQDLIIRINYQDKTAIGQTGYAVGAILHPVRAGDRHLWHLLWGFLLWAVLLCLTYMVIQALIPFLRAYLSNFDTKYVRKYSFENDTAHQCHYCLNEIRDQEEIVTKCQHIVHKHCWVENGCECADYGKRCKTGKQYLFDSKKIFSNENTAYLMPYALYGMIGGFFAWVIFHLMNFWLPNLFDPFATWLMTKFYSGYDDSPFIFLRFVYMIKINSSLIAGILLGLIPVFVLAYFDRTAQKNSSLLWVFVKSISGCIAGFLIFLLGSILIISNKAGATNFLLDCIPWFLAGCVWGLCLSIRARVVWTYIIAGGIAAGLLGFIVLFAEKWWGNYAVMLGFIAFSTALGIVFVSSRHIVHRYFLKYTAQKPCKVAIHKWMSIAGGSQEVTIGKSKDCTICIDWDDHQSLRDVNVKLYVDKKDKEPCLKVMDEHLVYNWTIAKKNDEFLLKHGAKFKLGNTVFQYIEKN